LLSCGLVRSAINSAFDHWIWLKRANHAIFPVPG
jgi:hypothetical protein